MFLFNVYRGKCFWCGRQMRMGARDQHGTEYCSIDELVPVSRGGRRTLENQVPAHRGCNSQRSNMVASEMDVARHLAQLQQHRGVGAR